jgi:DNA polymerase
MPLRYAGAHTGRLSGDWKLNVQNLPSKSGKDTIRRAFVTPEGKSVLTIDSSQIEARIVAWICEEDDLLEQFANDLDPYSIFASKVFERPITKADKAERFIGKTGILGLGYSVGATTFQNTVATQSVAQLGQKIEMTVEEAQDIVDAYRLQYPNITKAWRRLQNKLSILEAANDKPTTWKFGPCTFKKGEVVLPNGLSLYYYDLANRVIRDKDGSDSTRWMFSFASMPNYLYGGKLLENIVQALARIVVMDAAVALRKRLAGAGIQLALQVHDELVYVVDDKLVDVVKQIAMEEMTRRPTWAPDLPLAAEAGVGKSYGEAK